MQVDAQQCRGLYKAIPTIILPNSMEMKGPISAQEYEV